MCDLNPEFQIDPGPGGHHTHAYHTGKVGRLRGSFGIPYNKTARDALPPFLLYIRNSAYSPTRDQFRA